MSSIVWSNEKIKNKYIKTYVFVYETSVTYERAPLAVLIKSLN